MSVTDYTIKEILQKILIPISVGVVGFMFSDLKSIDKRITVVETNIIKDYVNKNDYIRERKELMETLQRIDVKIDKVLTRDK